MLNGRVICALPSAVALVDSRTLVGSWLVSRTPKPAPGAPRVQAQRASYLEILADRLTSEIDRGRGDGGRDRPARWSAC